MVGGVNKARRDKPVAAVQVSGAADITTAAATGGGDAVNFEFFPGAGTTSGTGFTCKSCKVSVDNVNTAIYVRVNGFKPGDAPTTPATGEASVDGYTDVFDDSISDTRDLCAENNTMINTVSVWVPNGNATNAKVQVWGVPA